MLGERRMANDNIYRYTIETIENYYPRIMKIKMANNLIRDGIATKNKKETDKIFVGDKEDYNRNLLGGLYRENPVKSRNYEAVKSSKKWENVGNSYIIPALLLYRYSYI